MSVKVMQLFEQLDDMLEHASAVPFSSKVMIGRHEAETLIDDIRVALPDDLKQAQWITQEQEKIMDDATLEAEKIKENARKIAEKMIKDAEENSASIQKEAHRQAERMVATDEITRRAEQRAEEIVKNANQQAMQIRDGAYVYAENIMNKLETNIDKINQSIIKNKSELKSYQDKNFSASEE